MISAKEVIGHTKRHVCTAAQSAQHHLFKEMAVMGRPLGAFWEDHSVRDEDDLLRCDAICGS